MCIRDRDHTVRLWDLSPEAAAARPGDERRGADAADVAAAGASRCLAVGEGHVGAVAAVAFARRSGAPLALSGGACSRAALSLLQAVRQVRRAKAAPYCMERAEGDPLELQSPPRSIVSPHDRRNTEAAAGCGAREVPT